MLEEYQHELLGIDLVKYEADLMEKHQDRWNPTNGLAENIAELEGADVLDELIHRLTIHRKVLLALATGIEGLIEIVQPSPPMAQMVAPLP